MAGTARLELQGLTDAVRRMMAQAEVESERLPRTRGDRPTACSMPGVQHRAPPHPRG